MKNIQFIEGVNKSILYFTKDKNYCLYFNKEAKVILKEIERSNMIKCLLVLYIQYKDNKHLEKIPGLTEVKIAKKANICYQTVGLGCFKMLPLFVNVDGRSYSAIEKPRYFSINKYGIKLLQKLDKI